MSDFFGALLFTFVAAVVILTLWVGLPLLVLYLAGVGR
mgnify:CR=1 FL=1